MHWGREFGVEFPPRCVVRAEGPAAEGRPGLTSWAWGCSARSVSPTPREQEATKSDIPQRKGGPRNKSKITPTIRHPGI